MTVPSSYLTSVKNLAAILEAIKNAQAPNRFTSRFLEGLGFKSTTDRLVVGVLKAIGFLNDSAAPTDRYFRFLDSTQSKRVLAEGVRDAYSDLFQVNVNAQTMTREEVKNKLKTLTQGQYSDAVLDKMAGTFKSLSGLADFSAPPRIEQPHQEEKTPELGPAPRRQTGLEVGGLVYNIQLVLPESRDPAAYDALFRSLKEHLSE